MSLGIPLPIFAAIVPQPAPSFVLSPSQILTWIGTELFCYFMCKRLQQKGRPWACPGADHLPIKFVISYPTSEGSDLEIKIKTNQNWENDNKTKTRTCAAYSGFRRWWLQRAGDRDARTANTHRLTHCLPMSHQMHTGSHDILLFFCDVNSSFGAASPTRCLDFLARDRTKQEGACCRDRSKTHISEKRGSFKDPAAPMPWCVCRRPRSRRRYVS